MAIAKLARPDRRVLDLIDLCAAGREARQDRYGRLRTWYERGTDKSGLPARFNKLQAHMDQLSAYLYTPEGTRFSIGLPPASKRQWMRQAELARDEFLRTWRDIGADVMFGEYTKWAGVYGASVCKLLGEESHSASVNYIYPGDLGVSREDLPSLDAQDVLTHWFWLSLSQVRHLVRGLPTAASILAWAEEHASPGEESGAAPSTLQQIIINTAQPSPPIGTFPGGMTPWTQLNALRALVQEPLVQCCEVWERADFTINGRSLPDYLVSTVIGDWTIMERQNPVLPAIGDWEGELPLVKICPEPVLDYFWGQSELEGLLQLQEWRDRRMGELDELYALQLDPPTFYSGPGMLPMTDEKRFTMRTRGANLAGGPQSKFEPLRPPMPDDPWGLIDRLDAMFAERGGLPPILQGQNEAGVRAGTQLADLAAIAAGRVRKKALIVEDALEVLATRLFHLMQREDPTAYELEGGQQFLLAHLPKGCTVKVSAHTSSPIYAQDLSEKADRLLKAGAIDLADYVELVNPPRMEELREKSRVLQAEKAKLVARKMDIEELKAQKKGR